MVGLLLIVVRQLRRRRKHYGPAAVGMFDEFLSKDRRKAVRVIVEERAEAVDPERAEGNLLDLKDPRKPG